MCLLENKEGTWTKEKLARRLGKLKKYAIQLFLCQKVCLATAKKREKLAKKKGKNKECFKRVYQQSGDGCREILSACTFTSVRREAQPVQCKLFKMCSAGFSPLIAVHCLQ